MLRSPSRVFLVLAIPFGVVFLLLTPPFQTPDEWGHFYRAFQVAELGWMAERTDAGIGGHMPRGLVQFARRPAWSTVPFYPDRKVAPAALREELSRPLRRRDRVFVDFPNTAEYSPLGYLPQALGIRLGTALSLSPLSLLHLARLTNLLIAAVAIAWLLARLPLARWSTMLLFLTPMCVFQFASCSADATVIALALLFVVLTLRAAYGPHAVLDVRDWAALGLAGGAFLLTKPYFAVLALPFVLVTGDRFARAWSHRLLHAAVYGVLAVLPFVCWRLLLGSIAVGRPTGVVPEQQLQVITGDPAGYLGIFLATLAYSGEGYLWQLAGVLGWLDTPIPYAAAAAALTTIIVAALIEHHPTVRIAAWRRLALVAIVTITVLLIHTMVYLYFTPVGKHHIDGFQGRYLLPVAPLLFVAMHTRAFRTNADRWGGAFAGVAGLVLATAAVTLFNRYYGPT